MLSFKWDLIWKEGINLTNHDEPDKPCHPMFKKLFCFFFFSKSLCSIKAAVRFPGCFTCMSVLWMRLQGTDKLLEVVQWMVASAYEPLSENPTVLVVKATLWKLSDMKVVFVKDFRNMSLLHAKWWNAWMSFWEVCEKKKNCQNSPSKRAKGQTSAFP